MRYVTHHPPVMYTQCDTFTMRYVQTNRWDPFPEQTNLRGGKSTPNSHPSPFFTTLSNNSHSATNAHTPSTQSRKHRSKNPKIPQNRRFSPKGRNRAGKGRSLPKSPKKLEKLRKILESGPRNPLTGPPPALPGPAPKQNIRSKNVKLPQTSILRPKRASSPLLNPSDTRAIKGLSCYTLGAAAEPRPETEPKRRRKRNEECICGDSFTEWAALSTPTWTKRAARFTS